MLFKQTGGVQFNTLGLTSALSGVTTTVTLYNSESGATTLTSFPAPNLSYVLGSEITQTINGASYQAFTNGTLSITTVANRPVRISIEYSSNGYINFNSTSNTVSATLRVIRGPSTVIGILPRVVQSDAAVTSTIDRMPCSAFSFLDLAPTGGAATYILEAQTTGLSTAININGSKLLVSTT